MRFHHIIEIDISERALSAIGMLAGAVPTPLVNQLVGVIQGELHKMVDRVAELTAEIETLKGDLNANTSATNSAAQLLDTFAQQLAIAITNAQAAGATDAQLADLSNLHQQIATNTDALAAAVARNTPADPNTPAQPAPTPAPPADTSGTGEVTPAPADQTGAPQSDGSQGDGAAGADAAAAGTGDGTVTGDQPQP